MGLVLGAIALVLGSLVPVSFSQSGGPITTVAGTGICGFSGNGVLGTSAQLNGPAGLAADPAGNVYIADLSNHVVRKLAVNGVITTFAGIPGASGYNGDDRPAAEARLAAPVGLAVDPSGRYLYIADNGNHRVRRVDLLSSRITTVAGTGERGSSGDLGPATKAQLSYPSAVTVDAGGSLFVGEAGNPRIRRVDPMGTISTVAGTGIRGTCGDGGPAAQACLKNPSGLAVSPVGELFVADADDRRVRRIDLQGTITTVAGTGRFEAPSPGPAAQSSVKRPQGLAFDAQGNLYISDFASSVVMRLSASGVLSIIAGTGTPGFSGDYGPATQAMLNGPTGLAVSNFGFLYISDSLNCRVRRMGL
jgi:sugar lactone lactonase YvrE